MSLYYPTDPNNTFLRPSPIGVDVNTGVGIADERVWFGDHISNSRRRFALDQDHSAAAVGEWGGDPRTVGCPVADGWRRVGDRTRVLISAPPGRLAPDQNRRGARPEQWRPVHGAVT